MRGPYIKERPSGDHFKIDPNPNGSMYLRIKRLEINPGMQPEDRHLQSAISREGGPRRVHLES